MKKSNLKSGAMFVVVMLFCLSATYSQNWKELDAKTVKTLAESPLIRASEVTIMPGEKGSMHTHPAHYFYALTECHLVIYYADGKQTKYDLLPGDSGAEAPERPHQTENVGDKPAKFLIVELKEHPYKAAKGNQ